MRDRVETVLIVCKNAKECKDTLGLASCQLVPKEAGRTSNRPSQT